MPLYMQSVYQFRIRVVIANTPIRRESSIEIPGQSSPTKQNMGKYFFGDLLSVDFWQIL